ncbi:MAG: hypothetical protein KME52_30815 [Desmonostoc geniculatum HA4340-LM1]|jgi:hypothetical protein|nr:hypothetical protein [Desmonostoc geniculatum HA4340-LM1]
MTIFAASSLKLFDVYNRQQLVVGDRLLKKSSSKYMENIAYMRASDISRKKPPESPEVLVPDLVSTCYYKLSSVIS